MVKTYYSIINLNALNFFLPFLFLMVQYSNAQDFDKIELKDTYPWCIVAYDSLERTPAQRIQMIKELGFTQYAYDWRDKHLEDTLTELKLATNNDIEIIGVWLWLNAKRDSINALGKTNELLFDIMEQSGLQTTFWVSLSPNFFTGLSDDQSLKNAIQIIDFVSNKARAIGCNVALYNHSGWFANPFNQLKILKSLPQHELLLVYNFHHAHDDIDKFQSIAKAIQPYLLAVNLNGMGKDGTKILPIGSGSYEGQMINTLKDSGFSGPWGIMGHVENVDVRKVLIKNINGIKGLTTSY